MSLVNPMPIKEQVADMAACWPQMRKKFSSRQAVQWQGWMESQFSRYRLDIRYALPLSPYAIWQPEVRVIEPDLFRQPGNADGILPHMYSPQRDPYMCLFDPDQNEWNSSMSIARTIVPWALDWLACYELWQMTGEWRGGGRHYGDPIPRRTTEQHAR